MTSQHAFRFSAVVDQARSQQSPNLLFVDNKLRSSTEVDRAWSRDEWIAKARMIEDLEYTTFLVPDHVWLDVVPVPALMAVADATSLRIGSYVFNNDFRHPVLLAREVAMLDVLSDGRFEFGLGCGAIEENYVQTGIPFDPPAVRVSRFEEAIHLIKQFFTQEEITFSGQYYDITRLKGFPKPIQKPYPPIHIGGGGKRVLSLAAREADSVGIITARSTRKGLDWASATHEATLEKVEWIREAAGERFDQLEIGTAIFVVIATKEREPIAQQMASRFGLTPEQLLSCTHMLIGTVDQMVEELLRRRERYGMSSIAVAEAGIEAFAPVVARLTGK